MYYGDVAVNFTAKWNGSAWLPLGGGMDYGVLDYVESPHNGYLIAGGDFLGAEGKTVDCIAEWDGTAWSKLAAGGVQYHVNAMAVYKGALIAGGSFLAAGNVSANRIAAMDDDVWKPLGTGINDGKYTEIRALLVVDESILRGSAAP